MRTIQPLTGVTVMITNQAIMNLVVWVIAALVGMAVIAFVLVVAGFVREERERRRRAAETRRRAYEHLHKEQPHRPVET